MSIMEVAFTIFVIGFIMVALLGHVLVLQAIYSRGRTGPPEPDPAVGVPLVSS